MQHVGPASVFEPIEFFLGPQPAARRGRRPEGEAAAAEAAGLETVNLQTAKLRIELHDVAAVVYLLRKVIWWVPGFTVETYYDRLRELIQQDGRSSRTQLAISSRPDNHWGRPRNRRCRMPSASR